MNDLMRKCRSMAKAIVDAYREQAPEGYDVFNDTASTPTFGPGLGMGYGSLLDEQYSGLLQSLPNQVRAAQATGPANAGISNSDIQNLLFGTPQTTQVNPNHPKDAALDSTIPATQGLVASLNQAGLDLGQGGASTLAALAPGITNTINSAGLNLAQGNLNTLNSTLPGTVSALNSAGLQLDQGAAGNLAQTGPAMMAAYNAANPGAASLVSALGSAATGDLASGYNLTPGLFNTVDQSVQASNIGKLGGTGDAGAYEQALGMSQFGNQQYMQRLQNAYSALGANQQFYGGMIPGLTGASGATGASAASGVTGTAGGAGGIASLAQSMTGGGSNLLSGASSLSSSPASTVAPGVNYNNMVDTGFNAQAQTNMDNANSTNQLIGSAISGVSKIASSS